MELVPCSKCARHARADEAACPFCGGPLARSVRRPRIVAQVTRALIFYAGALGACAEPPPPPAPPPAVAPLEPLEVLIAPAATEQVELSAPSQAVSVELEPEPRDRALAERRHAEARKRGPRVIQHVVIPPWGNCCPPYGAPPADTVV